MRTAAAASAAIMIGFILVLPCIRRSAGAAASGLRGAGCGREADAFRPKITLQKLFKFSHQQTSKK
jgi:hypothetical protein